MTRIVKRLAAKGLQRLAQLGAGRRRKLRSAAVHGVAEQRRPDVRHVHADLMRAARLELELTIRVRAETFDYAITRARGTSAVGHSHLRPFAPVPPNRRIDGAAARQRPLADSAVRPLDLAPLECGRQYGMAR